jgi:hypothetical protein
MKNIFIAGFLLFFLIAATQGPVQLREGYVVKVDSPETVNVVDRNGKSFIMKPAKDRQFVALHMSLLDYRSLGKYDYILEGIDKKWHSKCLLIGINNEAYSQLNWEFRAPGKDILHWSGEPTTGKTGSRIVPKGSTVRLLFDVGIKQTKASLVHNIPPLGFRAVDVSPSAEINLR